MEPIGPWLDQQYQRAGRAMLRSISAVEIVKMRPGFGQTVRPHRGSIVASPVLAGYDPDPDYFFHWLRDSAVVLDALRLLFENGSIGSEALGHLQDFVHFSLSLQRLDGRKLASSPAWRAVVAPDFVQFLRTDADLTAARGAAIVAETRVNPDGSLDISSWPRPQHDGPALRALSLLRWARLVADASGVDRELASLLRSDLDFLARHWREPSFDIWEEEKGRHYYTLCVTAAALADGAAWLAERDEQDAARSCAAEAQAIYRELDEFWSPAAGFLRSRLDVERAADAKPTSKELDIAVILAAIHANRSGAHSPQDPRMHATLERLEALFDAAYPINRNRPPQRAPAMGRYAGDVYYSGGAYYFSTLGAAEFCFRAAAGGNQDGPGWFRRGDAYLETVRAYTPQNGDMSEQFDQRTGEQTSARHLAWSYACFISCLTARRAVIGMATRS
jgi:glucoamylase